MLNLWDSLDAVRAFAGPDVEAAKYYPEDARFLLHFEPKVTHHHVPVAVVESAAALLPPIAQTPCEQWGAPKL